MESCNNEVGTLSTFRVVHIYVLYFSVASFVLAFKGGKPNVSHFLQDRDLLLFYKMKGRSCSVQVFGIGLCGPVYVCVC